MYGCRKADTGKMYAMKCLDKKRIKMKQGETLALNERIMLSLVSTGQVKMFGNSMTVRNRKVCMRSFWMSESFLSATEYTDIFQL